jgi:hypothetical protein
MLTKEMTIILKEYMHKIINKLIIINNINKISQVKQILEIQEAKVIQVVQEQE